MVSFSKRPKSEKKPTKVSLDKGKGAKPEKKPPKEKTPKEKAPKPPKPVVRYRPDVYTLLLLIAFLALATACVLGWLDISSYK